jgi:uncharacterized membrane protein
MIAELGARPDGVALESGLLLTNSEAPAVSLFAGKQSLLGWANQEFTWRGRLGEIAERFTQIGAFYGGTLIDPLGWLLQNNVKYVLWLPRDNGVGNARFRRISDAIKPRYFWHRVEGGETDITVGYWERIDGPPVH